MEWFEGMAQWQALEVVESWESWEGLSRKKEAPGGERGSAERGNAGASSSRPPNVAGE